MEIKKDYKGHLKWKDGARQHIHAESGETLLDAIKFMRDHIQYFGYQNDFTFNEKEIEHHGPNHFVFVLRHVRSINPTNVKRIDPEIEAVLKQ